MAVLGNSWLLRTPVQVLEQACDYLIKTIESNYQSPSHFSGVKFTMLLVLQNKEIYCVSLGDIKAVLYTNKKNIKD